MQVRTSEVGFEVVPLEGCAVSAVNGSEVLQLAARCDANVVRLGDAIAAEGAVIVRLTAATPSPLPHCGYRRALVASRSRTVSTFDEAVVRLRPKAVAMRELGVERLAMFGSVVRGRAASR